MREFDVKPDEEEESGPSEADRRSSLEVEENKLRVRVPARVPTGRGLAPHRCSPTATQKTIIVWCRTHFAEAFSSWMHIKALRVFTESVLRYGLPVNFVAALVKVRSPSFLYRCRRRWCLVPHCSLRAVVQEARKEGPAVAELRVRPPGERQPAQEGDARGADGCGRGGRQRRVLPVRVHPHRERGVVNA